MAFAKANDAAEAAAIQQSIETVANEEHARSFMVAERASHEELNAIRAAGMALEACRFDVASAQHRGVEASFRRANKALVLDRAHQETESRAAEEER